MADAARAALVIAADEFADPRFQRLRSPVSDVHALTGVLGDPTVGGFDVRTVVNQPSSVVQQELERFFSDRKADDLLLLYFSCHGVKDTTGRLYFATSNTTFDLLRSTGVSASFVSEQMEYSRSRRVVVLLDCCYSGAFLKGFRARGDDAVAVDQLEGRGRAVITASRATEYAFEADELTSDNAQPSMFTGAVVDGLTSGRADRNGDGLITVDELYDHVYDEVRGMIAGQTPGRWVDVEGDLVIARNPSPPVVAITELPAELQRAVDSDLAMQRLGAVTELARLLRSDDPAQQAIAQATLELLTRDYDERVKVAAGAALAEPQPATATVASPPPPPATVPVDTGAADPRAVPVAPWDTIVRASAGLAVAGGLALLLTPYFGHLLNDGYWGSLGDRKWYREGATALFLVVAAAAYLLRTARWRTIGVAIVAGTLPNSLAGLPLALAERSEEKVTSAGGGWFLRVLGLALLLAAGVLAAVRVRGASSVSVPEPTEWSESRSLLSYALAGAGLVVGTVVTLGWARVDDLAGDGWLGVTPPAVTFTLRLMILGAVVGIAWQPLRRRGIAARWLGGGAIVLGGAALYLFLQQDGIWPDDAASRLVLFTFVVAALGWAVVPVLSTVMRPGLHGAALLGGWTIVVVWLPSIAADYYDTDLLYVGYAMAAALAVVLARAAVTTGPPPTIRGVETPA